MSSAEQSAAYYSINRDRINAAKRAKYAALDPEARAKRIEQMKIVVKRIEREFNERMGMRRKNGRTAEQKRTLQARIDACQDPIIRIVLECFRNGESVERIAKAAKLGVTQVRGICNP